jgi:hypothetical protein
VRKIYITFSGQAYDITTQKIVEDGVKYGADEVWVYDDKWMLEQDFYKQNRWLWEHPHKRGFGWYAWKPYIIWDALSKLEDGDIVLFTDADCIPIDDFSILFDVCNREKGIMLFTAQGHRHFKWCKRDCFVVMGQDTEDYRQTQAGVARFMLFQKGHWRTTQFLMEWITYCVNPKATTFDHSTILPEHEGFIEHRTEQAIMTNLAHKYGIKLYRECCDAGEYIVPDNSHLNDRKLYGQLFQQINPLKLKVTAEIGNGSKYFNIESR